MLEPLPLGSSTELPAMVTTAKYNIALDSALWNGFVARCTVDTVRCFTLDQLAARPSLNLIDFLNKTREGASKNPLCVPTYYVDGFMRGYAESTLDDLEQSLKPGDVKGIEVYLPGEPIPMRWSEASGNPGCGSVVIWTK